MVYTVFDKDGNVYAGDPRLDEALTDIVDENPGFYIEDPSGNRVYGENAV